MHTDIRRRRVKNAALKLAVKKAGGQTALANAIGRKQASVWEWLYVTGRVSADDAILIEQATGVPAEAINPTVGIYAGLRGVEVRKAA